MIFSDYKKCIDFVLDWRTKHGKEDYQWPDSRDPEAVSGMGAFGIVPQDVEKALICLCAWREMRGNQYQGMSAVVHVIYNRQKAGQFQSHLIEDVEGKNQFSSMTAPGDPNLTEYPTEEGNYVLLLQNIDLILTGKTLDITDGALYYANINTLDTSGWFYREVISDPEKHARTAQIGQTIFYK